ncbi:MAG TPA: sensor histidine kinase [Clostridia bacterium]|nr:sensor histidine kinase [Clostridia bacterium]
MKNSRMFRTMLYIVVLCMCVPLLALGLTSVLLTERSSADSFRRDRTQQLTLINNTCDLLLDECSFIYYQLVLDENVVRALDYDDLTLPIPYAQLQSIQSLVDSMTLITGSRPLIHSISVYRENPYGLVVSSRYGLVRLATDPDRGWYEAYAEHRDRNIFARPRTIERAGDVLTLYFSLSNNLLHWDGTMAFHLLLRDMEALLPRNGDTWLVLEKDGTLLFSAGDGGLMTDDLRAEILAMSPGASLEPKSLPDVVLYQVVSETYEWRFINVTDHGLLSATANSINHVLMAVASLSLAVGALIAVLLTRRAARPIEGIVRMIRQIDEGGSLIEPQTRPRDEYEVISYNLLQNHISRQRLNEQLAQRQLRLQEAQMLALQAQINPHFLYNTLEIVNVRAVKALGESNAISHMIATLGDLLRYAMEKPGDLVPLSRELAHGRQYAELMACRLGNVFSMTWDIPSALYDFKMPKLILQPLIENAIQHGVQLAQADVVITVAAQVKEDVMTLTVSDDGAGMSESLLQTLREQLASIDGLQYKHIGLFNVYQRMRLVTKDQARMILDSVEGQGTCVRLSFPIQEGGAAQEGRT